MKMTDNFILKTDSYKLTHWKQYPPNTQQVYSYFESRGGQFEELVFFGLQYYIKKYIMDSKRTAEHVNQAYDLAGLHFGNKDYFNIRGWDSLIKRYPEHLPIKICALPEGTIVKPRTCLMTVRNTDPEFPWLTNYIETLLVKCWAPITVAADSHAIRQLVKQYMELTCDDLSMLDFMVHDFGYRGVSSEETAAINGAAHLIPFKGTDTLAGIAMIHDYYGGIDKDCFGYSVPASEHSTMTSWGREHELEACENMLDQYPTGIVSVVSDSWDIFDCCENIWGGKLKDKILKRDGRLVVRPDSGELPETVIKVLEILESKFRSKVNSKGYRVLPPQIGIIQGDGIEYLGQNTYKLILDAMAKTGFSASNIVFGSGGALLQKFDRDTCKFAFKCSSITVDGEERDVFKDPITDHGKSSKRGKLSVVMDGNGDYTTIRRSDLNGTRDYLEVAYDNGYIRDDKFTNIRTRYLNHVKC